jgi:hypothetical protein
MAILLFVLDGISEVRWVGYAKQEIRLVVIDASTGRPIEDALIRFFDLDYFDNNAKEDRWTNRQGAISIVQQCTASGTESLLRETSTVHFPTWGFVVSKQGWKDSGRIHLRDKIGLGQNLKDPTIPVVRIELQRESP